MTPKVIAIKREMTLQRMKEVIIRKLHREAEEMVATIHFRYPIRLGGGVSHYTAIEMTEDDDVEAFFDIYDSIQLQTRPEVYVTFERFASSSTQCQPTHSSPSLNIHFEPSQEVQPSYHHLSQLLSHEAPHPFSLDMNEPTHQHLEEWEKDMQSYTQLLSGQYISLDKHKNQQLAQESPQEHVVVGLPNEVFDPSSEDEDEILAAADDEKLKEPHAHHTNNQQHEHNSSYVPSEHFLHFPPEPPMYDPTFGNVFDRDTVVYPPGTLFVGQQFNTKEEAQDAINRFHIINHCTYKVSSSN